MATPWTPATQSSRTSATTGKEIGPIAKPKTILVVPELPKTRSDKIMRRLLKDVAEGREVGDATTLPGNTVMSQIAQSLKPAAS